jgi:hypothetical protein
MDKTLILGFYNRKNLGDDTYVHALPRVLKPVGEIYFQNMDDIQEIPNDVNVVVIGGGDVINEYFMKKAMKLLKDFKGRVYGVSVGIPYASASHAFLGIFDHLYVRSSRDFEVASKVMGEQNVTQMIDAGFELTFPRRMPSKNAHGRKRVALCLAQPAFYGNEHKTQLVSSILDTLVSTYYETGNNIEYTFLAFNTNTRNQSECDIYINEELAALLTAQGIPCNCHHVGLDDPYKMIEYFQRHVDIVICMRFHSVVFALMTNTRFIALYSSQKISNHLEDVCHDGFEALKLPVNGQDRPLFIDHGRLKEILCASLDMPRPNFRLSPEVEQDYRSIYRKISSDIYVRKIRKNVKVKRSTSDLGNVMEACKRGLVKYLNVSSVRYNAMLKARGPFNLCGKRSVDVARFICYIISNQANHPCVWGLANNLGHQDFCLYEAIQYIWNLEQQNNEESEEEVREHTSLYYPYARGLATRSFVHIDHIFKNDYSRYHRSGWAYAIGGLMNVDALSFARESNVSVDTYIDRTFHWCHDTLKSLDAIPYTKAWFGFVHHTFDQTHSPYNCVELLNNNTFVESLATCKGLITLTKYLAKKMRSALAERGLGSVSVFSLYHPMEIVDKVFTYERFKANKDKKVLQIGAWLRNPYAIYQLDVSKNPLNLRKVALKSVEMDGYFAPPTYLEDVKALLLNKDWNGVDVVDDSICRPGGEAHNKFCEGVSDMLEHQLESVEILQRVKNNEYDDLLSENVVFLNLVDCSAVNTVIECIVRNTVLVVNRLEPLEEVLGVDYPGFYDNLVEASNILSNELVLQKIYGHMARLNKARYSLDTFVTQFQAIVREGLQGETDLYVSPPHVPKYSRIAQYFVRRERK